MSKKKKIIIGVVVVILVIGAAAGIYLYNMLNGSSSIGINNSIVDENDKDGEIKIGEGKSLVLYFSETGNTQKMAKTIYDQVGGDLRRIETVTPYPSGQELFDVTEKETDEDARPEYKDLNINIDDYDTIYVGYPIWWYTMPQVMYTFFDDYDLSGKTIVPFNTHNGSGDGGTYDTIKELEPKAIVLEGLALSGSSMEGDPTSDVKEWLESIQ